MTKADLSHRLGYRIEGGPAIEVEGVCRFDESSIACWDGEGKKDGELTKRVESGLTMSPGSNNLQIRYGMKNRILVVRTTSPTFTIGRGDRRSLNLTTVGSDPRYGVGGYVQLPEQTPNWTPGATQIRYEARLFAVDKSTRETQMRLMMSEPLPKEAELKLAVNSRATLNGCTFRVLSIAPADANRMMFGQTKAWTVKIEQTGQPSRPANYYPRTDMLYVDKFGKLVDQGTYLDWQQKRMATIQATPGSFPPSEERYRPVVLSVMGSSGGPNLQEITINADPKSLGKIRMAGNYTRTIDVTGIPLDPR